MTEKATSSTIFLLTGDIGGTNSRMSLYSTSAGACAPPLVEKYYRNAEHIPKDCHGHPEAFQHNIIIPFLKYCWSSSQEENKKNHAELPPLTKNNVKILATLATAGVVADNRVNMTNLGDLLVDGNAIEANTSDFYLKHVVVCRVINDFVAQGYGCLTLKKDEVRSLHGPSDFDKLTTGPKVCLGAGTGLGECYLSPDSNGNYTCFPSEGGHVEYAPRNDLEIQMWKYLSDKFCSKHRISVERVVSGKGLANVYEFLACEYPTRIDKAVHEEFLAAGDEQGRVVSQNATEGSLCKQAMLIMASAYGCEAGSAALKWIPTGGLFLTGGLTPKNMHFIQGEHSDFMLSYKNKGRTAPLLDRVPLFAVMVEDLGVRGAHKAALMVYEQFMEGKIGSKSRGSKLLDTCLKDNKLLVAAATTAGLLVGMAAYAKRR